MQLIYKRFGVITGFVLLLILLVVNALITRRQLAVQVANQSRVERIQQVLIALNQTQALIKDAETGQRGYLLLRWAKMVESATSSDMVEPMSPIVIRSMAAESDEGSFWCSSPP